MCREDVLLLSGFGFSFVLPSRFQRRTESVILLTRNIRLAFPSVCGRPSMHNKPPLTKPPSFFERRFRTPIPIFDRDDRRDRRQTVMFRSRRAGTDRIPSCAPSNEIRTVYDHFSNERAPRNRYWSLVLFTWKDRAVFVKETSTYTVWNEIKHTDLSCFGALIETTFYVRFKNL